MHAGSFVCLAVQRGEIGDFCAVFVKQTVEIALHIVAHFLGRIDLCKRQPMRLAVCLAEHIAQLLPQNHARKLLTDGSKIPIRCNTDLLAPGVHRSTHIFVFFVVLLLRGEGFVNLLLRDGKPEVLCLVEMARFSSSWSTAS